MGVVRQIASDMLAERYEDLPAEVVHQVKRVLLDSLACIFGGCASEAATIVEATIADFGGPSEATVVGSGRRTSALNALLVNGAMLRFLDYNEVQFSKIAPGPRHGHNSELLPAILALAEREDLAGREAVVSMSVGCDAATRFTEAVVGPSLEERGWNMDLRAAYAVPLVAARLLGLTPAQAESAVGIALSRGLLLNVLDNPGEENSMAKNLRFPLTAHLGVMAAFLARRGLTGPARALEGGDGFIATVVGGDFDVARLTARTPAHCILDAALKQHASCYATHGHVTATLDLVREHDVRPEEVLRVRIRTTTRGAQHTGDPSRRFPTNKETADHSSHYLTAICILERAAGPAQFSPQKYALPDVRRLVDLVTIEGDPALNAVYPSAIVEIDTTRGQTLRRHVEHPRGHPLNPMTDAEIEEKFAALAEPYLSRSGVREVVATVWRFERLERVADLMEKLAARR